MKMTRIFSLLVVMTFCMSTMVYAEPTVCTSPKQLFSKTNFSDWTLPENQDRITESTWLTRQNTRGLFNINVNSAFASSLSPANTTWAFGSAADFQSLTFKDWQSWHNSNPPDTVGKDAVIHIIDADIYLDIKFLSWSQSNQGGGLSYERSTCSTVSLDIKANNTDNPISISPTDNLNLTISIDPGDRIGENVDWWLIAVTPSGIFHYDLSSNTWQPGLTATFQGQLFNLPTFTISTLSGLPSEDYIFYFAFDDIVNGILDIPNTLFDNVEVNTSS